MAKAEARNEPGTAARRPAQEPRAVGQRVEDEERDAGPGDDEGNDAPHARDDEPEHAGQEVRDRGGQRLDPRRQRGLDVLRQPEAAQELADRARDLRQAVDEGRQLVEERVEDEVDEGDDGDDQREDRDQRAAPPRYTRPLQPVHEPVHQEDEDEADDVRRQCLLGEDDQHRQPDEDAAEDQRVPGRWELHALR